MAVCRERLSGNMEDYLEVIHALLREKGVARVGVIATRMKVKSPSVNAAMKFLVERGLVVHEKYGCVTLTPEGSKLAAEVQEIHNVLFLFLTRFLMIESGAAEREACAIEHSISHDTFVRLVKFFEFIKFSPNGVKPKLLKDFSLYLKQTEN